MYKHFDTSLLVQCTTLCIILSLTLERRKGGGGRGKGLLKQCSRSITRIFYVVEGIFALNDGIVH